MKKREREGKKRKKKKKNCLLYLYVREVEIFLAISRSISISCFVEWSHHCHHLPMSVEKGGDHYHISPETFLDHHCSPQLDLQSSRFLTYYGHEQGNVCSL